MSLAAPSSHALPTTPRTSDHTVLIALTQDPALLEAVTQVSTSVLQVAISPSTDRFIDQLVANPADLLVIDAACAPAPLETFIASMREQFPQALLVLAGPPALQSQVAPRLADGTLFRFAHKPLSTQRLRLFVEAAIKYLDQRQEAGTSLGSRLTPGAQLLTDTPARARLTRRTGLVLGITIAAAGASAWLLGRAARTPPAPPPVTSQRTPSPPAPAAPSTTPAAPVSANMPRAHHHHGRSRT